MRRSTKLIVVLCIVIIFTGCKNNGKPEKEKEEAGTRTRTVYDEVEMLAQPLVKREDYTFEFDLFDCTQLEKPLGILCREQDILVVDHKKNTIYQYNYEGKVIGSIGDTGNGVMEFLCPTAITSYQNNIYILDALNYRIQILDEGLNYVSSIPLEELSPDPDKEIFWYSDIVVKNENEIYLTTNCTAEAYTNIYLIKDQKEQSIWRTEFNGYGAVFDDKVYFALSYELVKNGKISGQSYFLNLDKEGKVAKIDVPYKFSPADLIATNDYLYIVNTMFMSLDRFSLEGEYIDTLYKFTQKLEDVFYHPNYLSIDKNGDFYLTDYENLKILKVSKIKNE